MLKVSYKECELVGALIGDGHISTKCGKYIVGFTGNKVTDRAYFLYLNGLISDVWGKRTNVKITSNAVRITFYSKQVVGRLTNHFGIPANKGKGQRAIIPLQICANWGLAKNALKGLFDTDGSIFVSNKPGTPNYPSIELTTTSEALAWQVKNILLEQGFRVANIWPYCSKKSKLPAFKVPLNGWKNLNLWMKEIGFSNPYKAKRAMTALGLDFKR